MGSKSKKLSVDEAPTTRKGVFVKSPPERRQMDIDIRTSQS